MQSKVLRRVMPVESSRRISVFEPARRGATPWRLVLMTAAALALGVPDLGPAGALPHPVDPRCRVHLIDQPRTVFEASTIDALPAVSLQGFPGMATAQAGTVAAPRYRLRISNLQDGQTVWNDARELPLQLDLQPALAPDHRIRVYFDGKPKGGPFRETHIVLQDINRGPHRLQVRLVDGAGRVLAETGKITIYHHQHSVATPP